MDKRIIHMEGEGRYRMVITKYGRLGALRVGCSSSMVSLITNLSLFFFFDFFLICSLLVEVLVMNLLLVVLLYFM
nr:MAG TPA: hypothetical protein [Caudoviricetes sp.]